MNEVKRDVEYPKFKTENIIDTIHGHLIHDPYRWLEDPDSKDTKEFIKLQNEITFPFLNSCKYKEKIKEKLTLIWNFPTYSCIEKSGEYFYYFYNTGLQNQSVLYRIRNLDSQPEEFMNPNTWSEDGTISFALTSFSECGKYMAFGQSSSGHDWVVVKFINTETLEFLEDELQKIKFSSVAWTHNSKGVFYSDYLDQEGLADGTETKSNVNRKLRYHKIGTSQSADILCYENTEQPSWIFNCQVSDCGRYLILSIHKGCDPNVMVLICDLANTKGEITDNLNFRPLIADFSSKYYYITNQGTRFLFHADRDAPMLKVVEVDVSDFNNLVWKDVIATQPNVLMNWVNCADHNKLIVCYQKDVADSISIHCITTGDKIKDLDFPLGTINGFSGKWNESQIFIKFTSFLEPGINYVYDLRQEDKAELKILQKAAVNGINLGNFRLEQVFYDSKDGVKIPMFIMHHKDALLDGNSPCRLYGYGGFDCSIKPSFSVSMLVLMQHFRFTCAVANIRGGSEYGKPWHDMGRLALKQNCFDDFIAASEFLIANKYTNSNKLCIEGGSNGGLLVAACMNQRPDLFGAVIGHVGVLDMLRFHKFTIGHTWVSDFGDPDVPEQFDWIIKYSPLHNIKPNTQYPACLLLTADHDDRVVPLHTMKFIAELQEKNGKSSNKPLLVRIDVKSGHGAGKPTTKRIEECRDIICFLQLVFQLNWCE